MSEPAPSQPSLPPSAGLAIAALVLGIAGLIVPCAFPIATVAAVVCGVVALKRVKRDPARYSGKGMALTGIVLAALHLLIVPVMGLILLLPALSQARKTAQMTQSQANLRTLSIAMTNYVIEWQDRTPQPHERWRELLGDYLGTRDPDAPVFQAAGAPPGIISYHAVNLGIFARVRDPSNQVWIVEHPEIARARGGIGVVLWADGRTSIEHNYDAFLLTITNPDGTPWRPTW